jgi:hypothetical protein
MGVHTTASTIPGGLTPICNCCGVSLCWDISEEEYDERPGFWDAWQCRDCRDFGEVQMSQQVVTPIVGA